MVGIQDMGAAGLTCSTCEMGARAGTGIEIDIARVPKRETGMTAYEVMLSESQERMLLVAERGREDEIVRIFEKWDLHAEAIGKVTEGQRLRVFNEGRLEADVPNAGPHRRGARLRPAVGRAPQPGRRTKTCWPWPRPPTSGAPCSTSWPRPNIANKRWIYRQYDSTVRTNTLVGPGIRRGGRARERDARALAMSVDGNGRYGWLDPYEGARLAVAEACRNVAAAGGVPIGATNCLNFGNPERPEVMGQFVAAVRGIARRLPGPGRADHRRQRLALQRDGRPRRSIRRRSWAWSASSRTPPACCAAPSGPKATSCTSSATPATISAGASS